MTEQTSNLRVDGLDIILHDADSVRPDIAKTGAVVIAEGDVYVTLDERIVYRIVALRETTYETHEELLDAELEHPGILIADAVGIPWIAWPSEDGEWYATRPRNEDDGPGPEGDVARPIGPFDVETLSYPIRVTALA